MIHSKEIKLWQKHLPKLLAHSSMSIIPRSGEEAKKVDTFVIYMYENEKPKYMLVSLNNGKIMALMWDETQRRFHINTEITYNDLTSLKAEIIHYYGVNEIKFNSIRDYARNNITKYIYIKLRFNRFLNWYTRYRFARKELIVHERIQILRMFIKNHVTSTEIDSSMSASILLDSMYTPLWYTHPKSSEYRKTLELNLESLVSTGDLVKLDDNYMVTGKSLDTITRYELEESRYDQQLKTQKIIGWLTFAIVLLTILTTAGALVQAHIIEVPTLLDFSK
ncbi:hypothetical protein [Citrobacter portucalensis]|uniref:hypothetical protein n=1 Tax=Citrobacter portucalensis TaxID=1639133 RepID=UPI001299C3E4|nr:hypothetical protein [Citrobacter portucalensis]MRF57626.1 hypothetical protein [Citrobacter portucalensis]